MTPSPKTATWEERFFQQFSRTLAEVKGYLAAKEYASAFGFPVFEPYKIEEFIRTELATARTEERTRVVEYCRGEIVKVTGDEIHKMEMEEILKEAALPMGENDMGV